MHQDAKEPAAVALALCGETTLPEKLYAEVLKERPLNTILKAREAWLQARIALSRNQPAKALELSQPCIPFERGIPPISYLRGQIYLQLHAAAEAMAEFQQILGNKGVSLLSTEYPAALVGLARAAAMAGDLDKSRRAYQDFLALWKDADPDIPLLQEARREYEKLK